MTFILTTGMPSNGKSYYMAIQIDRTYKRNLAWYKKTGVKRPLHINFPLSEEYLSDKEGWFYYWESWSDLLKIEEADVFWDEISVLLDSYKYESLSRSQLQWLTHYAKNGIEIYANTQFFNQLAKRARQLATEVYTSFKVIGTPRPSPTRPAVKRPWGLIVGLEMENFTDEEALDNPVYTKVPLIGLPIPAFIEFVEKKYTDMYNTKHKIIPEKWLEARFINNDIYTIDKLKQSVSRYDLPTNYLEGVINEKRNELKHILE